MLIQTLIYHNKEFIYFSCLKYLTRYISVQYNNILLKVCFIPINWKVLYFNTPQNDKRNLGSLKVIKPISTLYCNRCQWEATSAMASLLWSTLNDRLPFLKPRTRLLSLCYTYTRLKQRYCLKRLRKRESLTVVEIVLLNPTKTNKRKMECLI